MCLNAKKYITLKDIAVATGCSVKTVSRAINGYPDINKHTKLRILELAKKYSYAPNLNARGLRQSKTYSIGYAVPDLANQFLAQVGLSVETVLKRHGYGTLISFTGERAEDEVASLELLLMKRVDGIILGTAGENGPFIEKVIKARGVPIVIINNLVGGVQTDFVLQDNINGAYLLTRHLLAHGHKRLTCITGPQTQTSGQQRLDGYRKALEESNLDTHDCPVKVGNWRFEDGYNKTLELLENSSNRPTAFFIANAPMALGALKALREKGLKVPDDVAVVSFDDLDFNVALMAPLTTLRKVDREIGEKAANLLLERMGGNNLGEHRELYIESELSRGQSCGCNKSTPHS